MNTFYEKELKGRQKFNDFLTSFIDAKIDFTTEKYANLDAFVTTDLPNYNLGVEIKDRNAIYEHYDSYIFEYVKFRAMCKEVKSGKCNNCWMCYFFGENLYLFDLKTICKLKRKGENGLIYKKLPNSTCNYKKDVWKLSYLLPKAYAYKYTKVDGRWKKISNPKEIN